MKFHGLSGGEIVAMVHAQFEPRTLWDTDRFAGVNVNEHARLYCPGCMQHSTIFLRDEKHTESGVIKPWHCRSCKNWFKRPKQLMRRGEVTGMQSKPGKEHYALVDFDAIRVMRAIDKMPRLLKSWTLWVHTDLKNISYQPTIVSEVILAIDNAGFKPDTYAEGARLYFFAEQLTLNEREITRTGKAKFTVEHLATGLGVGTRQLQAGKKWGSIRDVVESRLRALDSEMDAVVIGSLQTEYEGMVSNG